jgi:hypothetical protein
MVSTVRTQKKPSRPASKRPGIKTNGAHKKNGAASAAPVKKDYEVITLRIAKAHKGQLLAHCGRRAKEEGKQVSFNRAIIEWIETLGR